MIIVGNGIIRGEKEIFGIDKAIVIEGKYIKEIMPLKDSITKYPGSKFIDAKGSLILPGNINTHTHIYSAFARGMGLKWEPPKDFLQILKSLWWKIDKNLTLEDIKYSALVTYIENIKNGTTTIFDHHASYGIVENSLFTIGEVAKYIKVRSSLCFEVSDREGKEKRDQGIKENMDFIKYTNTLNNSMLKGMFGLHASFTLSDNTMEKIMKENISNGFHVHVAEGEIDERDSIEKYNMRVVNRLNKYKIFGEKTLAIHCTNINNEEMEILKETNTPVIHNPQSNMGNAVGCSPVLEMMEKGIIVGLGTDGFTGDSFESLKVTNIIHKHNKKNPSVAFEESPRMLFQNNSIIGSKHFGQKIGVIEKGALADIIIVDYIPPTPINSDNFNSHILFGVSGKDTRTSIINGEIVMRDREILGIDEEEIYKKARERAKKLWERI